VKQIESMWSKDVVEDERASDLDLFLRNTETGNVLLWFERGSDRDRQGKKTRGGAPGGGLLHSQGRRTTSPRGE